MPLILISSSNILPLRYKHFLDSCCLFLCSMPALLLPHSQLHLSQAEVSWLDTFFSTSVGPLAPCILSFSHSKCPDFVTFLWWRKLLPIWHPLNNFPLLRQRIVPSLNGLHLVVPYISVTVEQFYKVECPVPVLTTAGSQYERFHAIVPCD